MRPVNQIGCLHCATNAEYASELPRRAEICHGRESSQFARAPVFRLFFTGSDALMAGVPEGAPDSVKWRRPTDQVRLQLRLQAPVFHLFFTGRNGGRRPTKSLQLYLRAPDFLPVLYRQNSAHFFTAAQSCRNYSP